MGSQLSIVHSSGHKTVDCDPLLAGRSHTLPWGLDIFFRIHYVFTLHSNSMGKSHRSKTASRSSSSQSDDGKASNESPSKVAKLVDALESKTKKEPDHAPMGVDSVATFSDDGSGSRTEGDEMLGVQKCLPGLVAQMLPLFANHVGPIVKAEVSPLRVDLGNLKTELSVVKEDLSGLSTDMGVVKSQVAGFSTDLNDVKTRLTKLENSPTSVAQSASHSAASSDAGAMGASYASVVSGGLPSAPPFPSFNSPPRPNQAQNPYSTALLSPVRDNTVWDRVTDPCLLRMACKDMVKLEDATKTLKAILLDAGVAWGPEMSIEGAQLSKSFAVRFSSFSGPAKVSQILEAQKLDAKTWKKVGITSASGALVSAHLNRDKSLKTISCEINTRKLLAILAAEFPNEPFISYNRAGAIVNHGKKPVIRIDCKDRNTANIVFKPSFPTHISKDRILDLFEAETGMGREEAWG